MMHNLMTDPLLRVETDDGTVAMSLPGVLDALQRDVVAGFPFLQPHQAQPWHAFLCQLAVMAAEEGGIKNLADIRGEGHWRTLLRGLTPDFPDDEPWRLVVVDCARPAFLQPPVSEGNLAGFTGMKDAFPASPFDLDVLVSSKQHGVKDHAPRAAEPDLWCIALVMIQTFSGFLGKGNYGIARQNGGFAARHRASLSFSLRPGPDFGRDVAVILASPAQLREGGVYPLRGGLRLLWLEPWRGTAGESLPLQRLHPLFIEVARRIRLTAGPDGIIRFKARGTEAARVAAKEYNGNVNDPWLPINVKELPPKALNVKPHYGNVHEILFDRKAYAPALLQTFHAGDPEEGASVLFRLFMRTQGGSDGYYERRIPIPPKGIPFFGARADEAAETARRMAEKAGAARNKVLKPALLQAMQAAADSPEYAQKDTAEWAYDMTRTLDVRIDDAFFPFLWTCLEKGEGETGEDALAPWLGFLTETVRGEYQRLAPGLPSLDSLRYRALAMGELALERGIRKHLTPTKE